MKTGSNEIKTTYLLRGSSDFSENHFESGILSPGEKEFVFSKLNEIAYEEQANLKYKENGFEIYAKQAPSEKEPSTGLSYTYMHKNHEDLTKEGLYYAARFSYYGESPQPWL